MPLAETFLGWPVPAVAMFWLKVVSMPSEAVNIHTHTHTCTHIHIYGIRLTFNYIQLCLDIAEAAVAAAKLHQTPYICGSRNSRKIPLL